ncbi:MAG: hypothetical protein U0936_01605 [Planctomycetaceae bacterium]
MKIQKGNLSASNAAVIGVLVVVLLLVMPARSVKKSSTETNSSSSGSADTQQDSLASPSIAPAADGAEPGNPEVRSTADSSSLSGALLPLRPLAEICDEDLKLLSEQNPFFTKAIIAQTQKSRVNDAVVTTTPEVMISPPLLETLANSSKISLVYESTTGNRAAVLNDKVVYPGMVVDGDLTVQSISRQGLQLSSQRTSFVGK